LASKKAVTIYDIARAVGTSATTVSRALNGKGKLSEDMRTVILNTASELKYTPNPAARYLKTQRTNQIMLSIPSIQDLFFIEMINVIQEMATQQGYSLLVHSTQYREEEELKVLSTLESSFIDGVILVSLSLNQRHLQIIKSAGHPVVLCCTGSGELDGVENHCDFIGVNSYKGLRMAAAHILDQGHKNVGYLGFFAETKTEQERLRAFCDIMAERGLPINPDNIRQGPPEERFGYESGQHFARLKNRPTAICSTADMMLIGLYEAFEDEGISIPDDIAVIGMDNIQVGTIMRPRLSSVTLEQTEMGRMAAQTLLKRIAGSKDAYKSVLLEPGLIVRESSIQEK
jgi:LacI family transcriptional regulator